MPVPADWAEARADFDSIIELIHSTVAPTTWDEVGGPGSIAKFETNLSLVISQTQEVHEEIVNLLEQLRRMQDLQVTIEVRFITLSDSFFERIGVDFDFNIATNDQNPSAAGFSPVTVSSLGTLTRNYNSGAATGTAVAGLQSQPGNPAGTPIFTSDLDIPFSQGSYSLAVPQFGASTPRRAPRWASPSSAISRPTSSSTPPRAIPAATSCRPPRSRSSTASRRSSPTPRRRRS